jgi:hypothetical protein
LTSFIANDGSDYMNNVLFGQFEVPLASYWLGMVTAVPEIGDSGETIVEPTDSSYVRIEVPNTADFWTPSDNGLSVNAVDLVWPVVRDGGDWGLLLGVVVLDVPDIGFGRLLMCAQLSPAIQPDPGVAARIIAGGLTLSLASITPSYQPS